MRAVVLASMFVLASCGGSSKSAEPAEPAQPGHVVVSGPEIEILGPVEFVPASADIAPRSTGILDAVATTLTSEPTIKLVEVVVHGEDKGLAEKRASRVRDQLIARGVAPERLRASAGPEATTHIDFAILERTAAQ